MKYPEFLSPGDTVYIVAPAKAIEINLIENARIKLESMGYRVKIGNNFEGSGRYFSGTIEERLIDFQIAIDDIESKAILCARGGYGCVHLLDRLNWSSFIRRPKWLIGFSDITYFHQRINRLGFSSIHGTMPLNFSDNSMASFDSLKDAITKETYSIVFDSVQSNRQGQAVGKLIGGNLSILYAGLGTDDQLDFNNGILFIEDVAEPLYHIDRMLHSFTKARAFENIKGLIVGGMTAISDTEKPFGFDVQSIILSHFNYRNIPICFNFPAGHVDDNRALRLGGHVELIVKVSGQSELVFH